MRGLFFEDGFEMKMLFYLLGIVLVVEGLPYFAFPDKMKKWMATMLEIPDPRLRALGLGAMIMGIVIAFFCKAS
jgi:uncharacterized protein YjeT (DUF2065 family)